MVKLDIDVQGEIDIWLGKVLDGDRSTRCDSCNAQAFVSYVKLDNEEYEMALFFCGHHGAKNHKALDEQGWDEISLRDYINNKPSASSGTAKDDE